MHECFHVPLPGGGGSGAQSLQSLTSDMECRLLKEHLTMISAAEHGVPGAPLPWSVLSTFSFWILRGL